MLSLIASFLLLVLLYIFVSKPKEFLLYLLMIKPFIDLTVKVDLIGGFNALEISGILVFLYTIIYYLSEFGKKSQFNQVWIWLFLIINVFSFFIAFLVDEQNIFSGIRLVAQLYGSFFIYFLSYKYLLDNYQKRIKLYKIIWITILITGIINILFYLSGSFSFDTTRGVIRVGGIYGDAGTPSYLSVLSLIFGTLYLKINKKNNFIEKYIYIVTWIYAIITMYLTLTRSAVLMLLIFILMWWGLHQKKIYIVLPLIVISLYFAYKDIAEVQTRMEYEMEFLRNPSEKKAISMGTGRVGVWKKLINQYESEFTFYQKIFGSSKNYAAHNQFLAYLMQIGILGLMLFLIIIVKFYKRLLYLYRKTRNIEIFSAIVILSCFMALSISGHPFVWTTILWYLMIMLGLSNIRTAKSLTT